MVVKKTQAANLVSIIELVRNCKLKSFIEYFKDFKDFRDKSNGNFTYYSQDLLLLCLVANLSGNEGQNSIYRFGLENHTMLNSFYLYPTLRSPSLATINRFVSKNDAKYLSKNYREWLSDIFKFNSLGLNSLTVSFDGKSIKNDLANQNTSKCNRTIHYSGFIHEYKVMLNWNVYKGKKSSEPVEFRNLINAELNADSKSKLVIGMITSDCINTNEQTLQLLNSNNIGFVLTTKDNTPLLIQSLINASIELKDSFNPDKNKFKTKNHNVEVNIYSIPKSFRTYSKSNKKNQPTWNYKTCGIVRLIKVTRTNIKTNHISVRYYISNKKKNSKEFFELIRNHWCIENNLHREKDLVFKEDFNQNGCLNTKTFLTSLSNITISLINYHKMGSISQSTKKLSKNIEQCLNLLGIEGR